MVKIARSRYLVWPDRYYIWTYIPESVKPSVKKVCKSTLYAKLYCWIPYFTPLHADHVATYYHGTAWKENGGVIKGSELIKQGITVFNTLRGSPYKRRVPVYLWVKKKVNKRNKPKDYYLGVLRQWAYPMEAQYDAHRRRKYILKMNKAIKHGEAHFNKVYTINNYGNVSKRIATWKHKNNYIIYTKNAKTKVKMENIAKNATFPMKLLVTTRRGKTSFIRLGTSTYEIHSKEELNTILSRVEQFNLDPININQTVHQFVVKLED